MRGVITRGGGREGKVRRKGGGEEDGSEHITLCNSHLLWRAPIRYIEGL